MVRKQGSQSQAIMSYQSHQYALMPYLAGTYMLGLWVQFLQQAWRNALEDANKSDSMTTLTDAPQKHARSHARTPKHTLKCALMRFLADTYMLGLWVQFLYMAQRVGHHTNKSDSMIDLVNY